MYIIIRREVDLDQLDQLKDKQRILTRFVMNGCPWCTKTQPDWDNMTTTMTPQLEKHDAIAEIESQFVDTFRKFMSRHHKKYPEVRAYPSVYLMSRGVASPHQGRDSDSFIKLLEQMKMVRDEPKQITYSEKYSSPASFMERTLTPLQKKTSKSPIKSKSPRKVRKSKRKGTRKRG
jgi:hypothetical protein